MKLTTDDLVRAATQLHSADNDTFSVRLLHGTLQEMLGTDVSLYTTRAALKVALTLRRLEEWRRAGNERRYRLVDVEERHRQRQHEALADKLAKVLKGRAVHHQGGSGVMFTVQQAQELAEKLGLL